MTMYVDGVTVPEISPGLNNVLWVKTQEGAAVRIRVICFDLGALPDGHREATRTPIEQTQGTTA